MKAGFDAELGKIRQYLEWMSIDVVPFNEALPTKVRTAIERRREKATGGGIDHVTVRQIGGLSRGGRAVASEIAVRWSCWIFFLASARRYRGLCPASFPRGTSSRFGGIAVSLDEVPTF